MTKIQKKQQTIYLQNLLSKHSGSASQVQKFVSEPAINYQEKIINGKYQIKKRSVSMQQQQNLHSSRTQINNILRNKKELQEKLHQIHQKIQDINSERKHSKKMTEQQHQKFIKQMAKERKQAEQKRLQHIKQLEDRLSEEEKKLKQALLKQQQGKKYQKKKQLQKKIEEMNELRSKKNQQTKSQNQLLYKKMHEKILLDKINDRYSELQATTLQDRKKKLAQIRSLHKPLSKQQFEQHIKKIEGLRSQRNKSDVSKSPQKKHSFYQSSWYRQISQEPSQDYNKKQEEELENLKEKKDKQKKYANYVKQNFKPQIDDNKVKELKQKLGNSNFFSLKSAQDTRQLGLKYLKISKELADKNKQEDSQKNATDSVPARYKPINYLQQLKQQHKTTGISSNNFIQKLNKKTNMSAAQKARQIMQFAQKLQKKAHRKQQLQKINNNELDEQLDNLYVEAIEAKLSLLGKD